MSEFVPAQTGHARIWLIEGGARPDHTPTYHSCVRPGAIDWPLGDVTKIECPDPVRPGQFIERGSVQGSVDRLTTDLMGRFALDLKSELLRLAKLRCELDVQVHMGDCEDLSVYDAFTQLMILTNVRISNWGTSELGTLESGGGAAVDETAAISAENVFQIFELSTTERAQSVVTTEVVDVVRCDSVGCGDCDVESDGCSHFYAVTVAAGGSPGTPPDVVHTVDGGDTWYADDIDSLGAAESASAVGCLGQYVVVVSNDSNSLHYALKSEIDDVDYDETWTENATGFVAGGEPNDCYKCHLTGTKLFIVGDGGYIYYATDPTQGVTVLDAGAATVQDLNAVHAVGDTVVLAVGNGGTVVYATDGASFQEVNTAPVGVGNDILSCWAIDKSKFLVGIDDGRLYFTKDAGDNWTLVGTYGTGIRDIAFPIPSVGYLATDAAGPRGRIYRSYDGGERWKVIPEGVGTIPANDRINAVAACPYDVNLVVGVGLGDDGTDGYVVVGSA